MKIQLVVASGVHQGKAIPVPNGKITIGRDPSCQLRPASPAVSKLHCTIEVRDGQIFVTDHDSTNGTLLGEQPVIGEIEAPLGSRLRVGPLDFSLQAVAGSKPDNTPLPDALKSVSAPVVGTLADAVGSKANVKPVAPAVGGTPMPMTAAPPMDAEKPTEVLPPVRKKPASATSDADAMAAALLAEDDDSDPLPVPEGSTVMEIASIDAERLRMGGAPSSGSAKPVDKKPKSSAETSAAADEILKKYRRGGR